VHAMHSNKHFSLFSFITPNAPMSITTETDEVAVGLWPSADAAGAVAGHVTRRPSPAVLGIGRKNWLKTFATYHASPTCQRSTPCPERRRPQQATRGISATLISGDSSPTASNRPGPLVSRINGNLFVPSAPITTTGAHKRPSFFTWPNPQHFLEEK
jgi:hypothetical protein